MQKQTNCERISILGATGSIGDSTLDILSHHKENFEIVALTAHENVEKLIKLARTHQPELVVIANPAHYQKLKTALADTDIEVAAGLEGLLEAASRPVDRCMAAIVGFAGLPASLKALEHAKIMMLANKECLVSAGDVFMAKAAQYNCQIVPVDSEHNALYQLIHDRPLSDISHFTLTASGGPFREFTHEQLQSVTPEMAKQHPTWSMGDKISIDSASLMNKGLELIEAKYLFDLPAEKFDAIVHPQSIIHGFVHMNDGSVLAHMGAPDMRIPISYCLGYPDRLQSNAPQLNLSQMAELSFDVADEERFPCLRLAKYAMETGGGLTTALNAANEVAVGAFLEHKLSFLGIPALIEAVLPAFEGGAQVDIDTIYEIDRASREMAQEKISKKAVF